MQFLSHKIRKGIIHIVFSLALLPSAFADTITIATVSNRDMLNMKELSSHFSNKNPDINVNWEIVDESVLRLMQSRDSKRDAPRYDIYTIGFLEAPLWGAAGRLAPVPRNLVSDLSRSDWVPETINGFKSGNNYYGLPFYGESSITYYRGDVLDRYGISIPDKPTWDDIKTALSLLKERSNGTAGRICLRGKPAWGENMAFFSTLVNGFGGRWFDEKWQNTVTEPEWYNAVEFYLNLQKYFGLSNAWENGYSENLAAFINGDCDIWVDSTAAGGSIATASFYNHVRYAEAPTQVTDQGTNWLWSWGFSVSSHSSNQEAAWKFISWATSQEYHKLVEQNYGISQVPPGARRSLYRNPAYLQYATFAEPTIRAISTSDFDQPSALPVPYRGIQFVQIQEFQQIGNYMGNLLATLLKKHINNEPIDIRRDLDKASQFVQASRRVSEYLNERDIDAF